ncbi:MULTISPECIES: helix-turn-helix transcriptional regulator [Pseudoalteromonas]|uniref:helix-turn-helix transcriptional regulator n=1 Tax=Pseudoalteromonas TaxID=53246 RepID=UPI001EFC8AD9|nr:helix-turn-helix transcriptional regulator [Pseudoalteromonas sp. Isolate6]MCG9760276.1 helix-turn-helix transcriptional regulator [Pseudoalteromonas sp. Isolate6]
MSIVLDLYSQLLHQGFYDHVSDGELHNEVPLICSSISQVKLDGIIYHRSAQTAAMMPENYGSLILITEGSGWWLTEQSLQRADLTQLIYLEANQKHVFHLPTQYLAVSFNFPINWLASRTGKRLQHGQALTIPFGLATLFKSALTATTLNLTAAKWLEDEIVLHLSACQPTQLPRSPLAELKQLISTHANDEAFCIDMLCDHSGWSKRYIHKLFAASDLSASEYLIRTRLTHAYFELLNSSASLNQIAIDSGFKNQAHFSRRFKQLFSLSPKQISQRVHS